jgi:DNA-directed RNA polymerase specialized sigma24 family protein
MKIRTYFEGASDDAAASWPALLEELAAKQLLPLLQKHGANDTVLHATLSKRKRGSKSFIVKLHMHLPGKKIVTVNGEGKDARIASETAMTRLFRESKKHVDLLRHQDQYKRRARRERLHALKAEVAALPAATAEAAQAGIEPLLARLEAVARRELAYLRAVGDLPADYPTVADVVDEAAGATKAAWQPGRPQDAVYRQLLKNLFKAIDREVAASRQFGESVSLEARVPADAEDQAEAMVQEEIYEYYQPDESLHLADVLPAEGEAGAEAETGAAAAAVETEPGEAELEAASEAAYAADVLKALPVAWRRALLLAELDALTAAAIAEVLDASEAAVTTWIEQASAFVGARLADAGITVADRAHPIQMLRRA